MAAIKYQNISIYDRRGSLEGTKISSFLDTNNIEHNYLGKFTSDTANAQINFLSTHFPGITLPACIYEAVYYENGNFKVANNEFSISLAGLPSNFANAAVKTS